MQQGALMLDLRRLQHVWYGGGSVPWSWRILAALYGAIVGVRRRLYAARLLGSARLPVPVIVVGNITAGGTGKTPLSIALVQALRARGLNPGVVSRGYGGSARTALRVDAVTDPRIAGDEACLMAQATSAPVVVGRDRVAAARLLLATAEVDIVISDDGLQHYALRRDAEICVIDGDRRFGNGLMLPAGPLREPVGRAGECDFRVCNGGLAQGGEIPMTLATEDAESVFDPRLRRALASFAGERVHAVAGIGNPQRFFDQLRGLHIDVVEHAFADHFEFAANDIQFGDALPVLMTRKDAVKCAAFADERHWSVPVRAQLPEQFYDNLADLVRRRLVET